MFLRSQPPSPARRYNEKADVYSLGVLMFELFSRVKLSYVLGNEAGAGAAEADRWPADGLVGGAKEMRSLTTSLDGDPTLHTLPAHAQSRTLSAQQRASAPPAPRRWTLSCMSSSTTAGRCGCRPGRVYDLESEICPNMSNRDDACKTVRHTCTSAFFPARG